MYEFLQNLWEFLSYSPPEYNCAVIGTAAAAILGGSAIVSGLANLFGQSSANKANLQATRETNEMNYKIAQEANAQNRANMEYQNQWNLDQWHRENLYNSAGAQVARYRAAGLDPAQAMQGQSAGVASSLTSENVAPAVAPNMVAPHENPLDYSSLIGAIGQAGNLLYDSMIKSEQAKGLKFDNLMKEFNVSVQRDNHILDVTRKLREIDELRDKHLLNQKEYELKKQEILFGEKSFDFRLQNVQKQNEKMDQEMEASRQAVQRGIEDSKRQDRLLSIQQQLADAGIRKTNAEINKLGAEVDKINQDMSIAIQRNAREGAEAYQKRLERQLAMSIQRLQKQGLEHDQAVKVLKDNLELNLMDSNLQHEYNKDASIINSALEMMLGVGFRDVGNVFKSSLNPK